MTFFDYSEKINAVEKFGIRDDEEGKIVLKQHQAQDGSCKEDLSTPAKELPAFIDYSEEEKWNAVVISGNREDYNFIPVDKNIPYLREEEKGVKRCDAIIWTPRTIIFIELKDQREKWLNDAILQIKATIELFERVDDITYFKYKKAYVCNKARPYFNYQFSEIMQKFHQETGVTLNPQKTIIGIR